VNEMFDVVVTAALEHVDEADDVAVDVGVRVGDRVAHAGLGGQVDNYRRLALVEEPVEGRSVDEVELAEGEGVVALQAFQTGQLERNVVVVIDVINAHYLVTAGQESLGDVIADETGVPCY